MSAYLYSAKNNVFVMAGSPLLDTDEFSDAKEVGEDIFTEFLPYEKDGKRRGAGADGLPEWQNIPQPTAEEVKVGQVSEAVQKKSLLLATAKDTISGWQTDLFLGIIDDAEKAKLTQWRLYIKQLDDINTDAAPDIEWPVAPVIAA